MTNPWPPLPGTALTEADYENLLRSWIDSNSADKALLRRVSSVEGAELMGQRDARDYAGIVIPNIWPGERLPREYRLRRDAPEITYEGGVRKDKRKYLSPPGRGNLLYFVPGTPVEWLADTSIPLITTEGEKKAIALWRLAWHELSDALERPRFLPVAISGVWNWRGTTGKEVGPAGERRDTKGPISDFARLVLDGRNVTILFDSDVRTNEKVRSARVELARYLIHERGATVHFVDIPSADKRKKTGIDDYLAAVGPERTFALIRAAKEARITQRTLPQVVVLEHLLEDAEFFHTRDQRPYATVPVNGHRETWCTRSQAFRNCIVQRFYLEEKKPPSTQAVQEILALCEARAQFEGQTLDVGARISSLPTGFALDLANETWEVIEVTPSGWRVCTDTEARFTRPRGMSALPGPIKGGHISELRAFLNAADGQNWILTLAWLVAALSPTGPYPILILQGEQGTGKSTIAKVLRSLVDPSTASLRSAPRDERDLMIAATNSWVISLDNLSGIQQWLSDALCRLSTGGGFTTRQLHTDNEEILFDATRPIILNGIDDIGGNADLADRAVIVTLPRVADHERIPEALFWARFHEARPRILGCLLDVASAGIRNLNAVQVPALPRMADFARLIYAAAPALPFSSQQFLDAYTANRRDSVSLSIEASPVASSIQTLTGSGGWNGTFTELLAALSNRISDEVRKSKAWPIDARGLSSKILRIAPLLRQEGIEVAVRREGHASRKIVTLSRIVRQSSDRSDRNGESSGKTEAYERSLGLEIENMDAPASGHLPAAAVDDDAARNTAVAANSPF